MVWNPGQQYGIIWTGINSEEAVKSTVALPSLNHIVIRYGVAYALVSNSLEEK